MLHVGQRLRAPHATWPMWETSKIPAPERTAMCSARMPSYWTGISHPAKGTRRAPAAAWRAWSAVLRRAVWAASVTSLRLPKLRRWPGCASGVRGGDLAGRVEDVRDHSERGLGGAREVE